MKREKDSVQEASIFPLLRKWERDEQHIGLPGTAQNWPIYMRLCFLARDEKADWTSIPSSEMHAMMYVCVCVGICVCVEWVCDCVCVGNECKVALQTLQLLQLLEIPAKSLSPAKRCTQVALTETQRGRDEDKEREREGWELARRQQMLDTSKI